ncbi:MAG: hypothetical protein ACLQU2_35460 [Candidatus Binataceae bacterium]
MTSVLYISYDGIMEPLGYSQVLQYLKRLAPGRRIALLTYEKPADLADRRRRARLAGEVRAAGIKWIALRYHKRPSALATLYDLLLGTVVSVCFATTGRVRIVHARSYVPSVIAVAMKKFLGLRFVFDMRGFWADERVEG